MKDSAHVAPRFATHALLELCKPRLTNMVVTTTLCGAAVAPGALDLRSWVSLFLGTWGVVGAANAFNCYLERDVDALMERTRDRPIVTGVVSPLMALLFSIFTAAAALGILYLGTNTLTFYLGALGFVLYVACYTPLKRISMSALFLGAVPGAIPPMMGWAAAEGRVGLGAWILFGILFFWQLPHFIAISLNRSSDYNRAGLKTLSNSLGQAAAMQHMLIYSTLLVGVSVLPYTLGLAGTPYLIVSLLLGSIFVGACVASFLNVVALNWGRVIFFGSLFYLPLVLGGWVFDQWLTRTLAF
jgi:protoheme IX farnesyltransferase